MQWRKTMSQEITQVICKPKDKKHHIFSTNSLWTQSQHSPRSFGFPQEKEVPLIFTVTASADVHIPDSNCSALLRSSWPLHTCDGLLQTGCSANTKVLPESAIFLWKAALGSKNLLLMFKMTDLTLNPFSGLMRFSHRQPFQFVTFKFLPSHRNAILTVPLFNPVVSS